MEGFITRNINKQNKITNKSEKTSMVLIVITLMWAGFIALIFFVHALKVKKN